MKGIANLLVSFAFITQSLYATDSYPIELEDYRSKEAFQTLTEQRFPVGSSYIEMDKALIGAGMKKHMLSQGRDTIRYRYDYKSAPFWMLLSYRHWIVVVDVFKGTSMVKAVNTNFGATGL